MSFKNCLLIMTSNIGSNVIAKGGGSLGFVVESPEEDSQYTRIRTLVMEELKVGNNNGVVCTYCRVYCSIMYTTAVCTLVVHLLYTPLAHIVIPPPQGYFRPELLNRLDEVVVFRQLGEAEVRTIADILLRETAERMMESRGIHLQVTAATMEQLCAEGYDQAYGARPLRRAITRLVEDALSDAVLHGRLESGDVAVIDVEDGVPAVLTDREWSTKQAKSATPSEIVYSSVA